MLVAEFDYRLPPELIAQDPPPRGESRLYVLERATERTSDASIADLPRLLRPGDVMVFNNTRVIPARLLGRRVPSGGGVECLLLGRLEGERWDALVHPGQKLRVGERFACGEGPLALYGEILERRHFGRRTIRLWREDEGDVDAAIDAIGHVPLPPYIKRADRPADRERYQTVYATARGSAAAPTAGLHFTDDLLEALGSAGIERVEITLHVGYGTFKPVRAERVEDHTVDAEAFEIAPAAAAAINRALDERRRVIAVGTTTTRALETAGRASRRVHAGAALSNLFIVPGFAFAIVGGLLTNFHLPRSSLLMLVAAFAGRERILAAYRDAIEKRYRFYSYGDAMLIL